MSDSRIIWSLLVPFIAALYLGVSYLLRSRISASGQSRQWLDFAALCVACGGLLLQAVLLVFAEGRIEVAWVGFTLVASPLGRLGVIAANSGLFCALIVGASQGDVPGEHEGEGESILVMLMAGFAATAMLVTDPAFAALCLFGCGLIVAMYTALPLLSGGKPEDTQSARKRLSGVLKQLSMSLIGTILLVSGGLLLARYPYNLENANTLRIGLGLLSVGLAVRVGMTPFAAGAADLLETAPRAAMIALGAIVPAVIVTGLLALQPLAIQLRDVSQTGRQVAAGLAVAGALLAGLRSLGAGAVAHDRTADRAALVGATLGLQTGWALFGVFSGTEQGILGAELLAMNLALAAPLVILSRDRLSTAVGIGALLGLPLSGGFVGTMLVAQAAASVEGIWLAALLLASFLVALAWLGAFSRIEPRSPERGVVGGPTRLLTWSLIGAQAALFILSFKV